MPDFKYSSFPATGSQAEQGKSLSTAEIPKSGVMERAQELEPANWVALVKPLSALDF